MALRDRWSGAPRTGEGTTNAMTKPHINPPPIPNVPPDTTLNLRPDEWSHCAAIQPGAYLDMTVSRVHSNVSRDEGDGLSVWVVGHRHPECTWDHVEPHVPCLQLLVRVDALDRAVNG